MLIPCATCGQPPRLRTRPYFNSFGRFVGQMWLLHWYECPERHFAAPADLFGAAGAASAWNTLMSVEEIKHAEQ